VNGVELEGLEVVLINKQKDPLIFESGISNKDRSAVHVYAHGTPSNIDMSGNNDWSSETKDFKAVLEKSDVYQMNKKSDNLVVILHSCRLGRSYTDEKGNYVPSYAEEMSAEFPKLTIIAPDERDAFNSLDKGGEIGPRQIDDPLNTRADYKPGAEHHVNIDKPGNWNVFKDGKLLGSYSSKNYDASHAPNSFEKSVFFNKTQSPIGKEPNGLNKKANQ